jgi:hypothetical protein
VWGRKVGWIVSFVMPGLVPGIHALGSKEDVDGRDEPGHADAICRNFRYGCGPS